MSWWLDRDGLARLAGLTSLMLCLGAAPDAGALELSEELSMPHERSDISPDTSSDTPSDQASDSPSDQQPDPPTARPASQPWPRVAAIHFEGNGTTQRHVMMRELHLAVGDPADPKAVEASRQSIQDLGLFRQVSVAQQPVAGSDAGVELTFTVEEKWYLVPFPRLDYNSDREFAFGFQVDWANVAGLNHRFEIDGARQENAEVDRGDALEYEASYFAPYFLRSPFDIALGISQDQTPITEQTPDGEITYEEDYATFSATLLRRLTPGRGSQGWRIGGGVFWQREMLRGDAAPPENGEATALVALAEYRQIANKLFSEVGRVFSVRTEVTTDGLVSDYDFINARATYFESVAIGSTPHQTLAVTGSIGSYHGGPRDFDRFALGGGNNLRGYDKNIFEGDAFWNVSVEYQRPVFGFNPVRGLLVFDAGRTYDDGLSDFTLSGVKMNAGVGLRWRIQTFVNLTLEIGMAWPLTDGGSELFFGKV